MNFLSFTSGRGSGEGLVVSNPLPLKEKMSHHLKLFMRAIKHTQPFSLTIDIQLYLLINLHNLEKQEELSRSHEHVIVPNCSKLSLKFRYCIKIFVSGF